MKSGNGKDPVIRKVVVAGGGTAGWMAAAAITKLIGKHLQQPVTLIESEQIGTIGVGEATIPTLKFFHSLLGINENNFVKATQATFKLGINFENWRRKDHAYFHAFGMTGRESWACGFQHFWLRGREMGLQKEFGEYCLEWRAAHEHKFKHLPNHGLNHAYHLDASAYGQFLRRYCGFFDVNRIEGLIDEVVIDDSNGHITGLRLQSGDLIEGDLFIDCTGQRALLIGEALGVGYEDWSHWLPCDSAIAVQTEAVQAPLPYTRAIAHDAGWQWQIPLQTRVGNGLVYSSRFKDHDAAEELLLEHIQGATVNDPRHIRFLTGVRRQHWSKNCVAVGLSSGFLEPLESTSIHLIQSAIVRLLKIFPYHGIKEIDIRNYNDRSRWEIERIRDFIILHYHATERDDSDFWNYCRTMEIPDLLQNKIDAFRQTGRIFRDSDEMFGDSWKQVMLGQGIMPQDYHPIMNTLEDAEVVQFLEQISHEIQQALDQLVPHEDYLQEFTAAATLNLEKGILAATNEPAGAVPSP